MVNLAKWSGFWMVPVALLISACGPPPSGLGNAALDSAMIEGIRETPVVLENGVFEGEPFEPGAASRPRVGRIQEFVVRGDLGGDGQERAAVLLWSSEGGSGTFLWMSILESAPERPRSVATTPVGDRVQIIDFVFEDGGLILDCIAAGPQDAACCPNQHERRSYEWTGSEIQGSSNVLGTISTADLTGRLWQLEQFGRDGLAPEVEVTLEFSDASSFSGNGGCNLYSGTVSGGEGGEFSLSATASTMRRCPEDMAGAESQYMMRLARVSGFSFFNGRLLLRYTLDGEEDHMSFSAGPLEAKP